MIFQKSTLRGFFLGLVALIASLQCEAYVTTDMSNFIVEANTENAESAAYPENAFLAGEDTPVWLAHRKNKESDAIQYDRLEKGFVKRAVDYFKSSDFHGAVLSLVELAGGNISSTAAPPEPPTLEPVAEGRGEETFYYPSLLVVVEFSNNWPSDKDAQEKLLFNKVLYVLAYWNEVEKQFRRVRYPGVRLRIAGIVIARDGDATPPSIKTRGAFGMRIYDTFQMVMPYWHRMRNQNPAFTDGVYNVVATMVDTSPIVTTTYGASRADPNCDGNVREAGVLAPHFTGLMVYDNQHFYGITQTVAELAHIMGRPYTGPNSEIDAATFTADDLSKIKNILQYRAECWRQPLESNPPGKPVEAIQKEDVLPH